MFELFRVLIGQLVRRIDLYELNVDSMNRLIVDPINHGIIVTDGGNKKVWAIGPEGEKKFVQYRPWRKTLNYLNIFMLINLAFYFFLAWSIGFLTTDTLVIVHAGCITFHIVNHSKPIQNGAKIRNSMIHTEKV